jgi:hypothetical protein
MWLAERLTPRGYHPLDYDCGEEGCGLEGCEGSKRREDCGVDGCGATSEGCCGVEGCATTRSSPQNATRTAISRGLGHGTQHLGRKTFSSSSSLDLACAYKLAYKINVSLRQKFYGGRSQKNIQSFASMFELYAMQASVRCKPCQPGQLLR